MLRARGGYRLVAEVHQLKAICRGESDVGEHAVGDAIKDFAPKRLRSGVETALASLAISREVRAQLQSHGLGGVQDRHYDDHDYLAEKSAALQALLDLL